MKMQQTAEIAFPPEAGTAHAETVDITQTGNN
jgi:hypothetical protein